LGTVTAFADAIAGNGGSGSGVGFSGGNGGNATAIATATDSINTGVTAIAQAFAGAGGPGTNGAAPGLGGTITATATANGVTISQTINPTSASANSTGVQATSPVPGAPVTVSLNFSSNINNGAATVTGPFATIAGITGAGSLTVGDGFNSTLLRIPTNSGGNSESSLTVQANSTLDLTNNHLLINYGSAPDPISTIRAYLTSGFNGGTWIGPGIESTSAHNNPHYALGYADGADGVVAGLSSGQIEIKYTLLGDANLDGLVSGDDFTILASNLGKQVSAWDKGDFNYDGLVNGDDFTALVSNLGKQASGADVTLPASDYAAIDAFATANGFAIPTIAVPEPACAAMMVMAGLGILSRRQRSSR
jgi:hypothetical protein